ncbi:MAG: MFS transporter [Actinobacteria bacterium]|nr:MAG: MFS transporter [Actinomycetota bacterium]
MRLALPGSATLGGTQRRLLLAMTAAAVMVQTLGASFNYILDDMLRGLGSSASQSDFARQMPTVGALLVIFISGALGQRLGSKRVILACCGFYALGSALVAVAPSMPMATSGLLLANIGKAALLVVALASLSATVRDSDGRATAFAVFSAAIPFAYLFVPFVAAVIVESAGWRWVTAVWVAAGVMAMVLVWALVPADTAASQPTGEMLTPALAGLVLALAVESITQLSQRGPTTAFLLLLAACAGAIVALVLAMRRIPNPTLDLAPLRRGNLVLLLVVLVLTLFANLFFYMTMALQYVYRLSPVDVALAMAPAQLCAVIGATASGRLVRRWGITTAGSVLMGLVAATLICSAALRLDSPLWLAVLIVSVYAAAAAGGGVAVTNAVMDTAPPGKEGAASAFRGAAAGLGTAIGVAGMTSIVIVASSASLHNQSVKAGIDPSQSTQIARDMAQGATSEDASSLYAVPVAEVTEIDDFRRRAYLHGFKAHGLVGGVVTLAAGVMFFAVRRRQERRSQDVDGVGDDQGAQRQ